MPENIRKVNIIGHLHPDTDSICSAISYAYLKNQISDQPIYEARRAGSLNRETSFVLKHFGFKEPELITTVTPQIKDIEIQRQPGIDENMSLFAAWNLMQDIRLDTLCVTDDNNDLVGLVAVKDIANANMDIDTTALATARTKYANVISTLQGEMVLGDPEAEITRGNIRVGTTPEMMEDTILPGDIVLVTNRYETQQFAVECEAGCLVICCGAHISKRVLASAEHHGCTVITTPYDTYAAARLISMSAPVRSKMLTDNILKFSVNTSLDDARKVMGNSRHRFFPVLDDRGAYAGLVSSPNMLNINRKHVILVDHSEKSQAVDGLDQAEIMEIIDHHRIGTIETNAPIVYRAEPVGCTCTILYSIYQERGVEIPANIAGLMMSAILSDTLCFRSPTCTPRDEYAARQLAQICGEDVDEYSDAMFEAGADLTGRTAEDVFNQDFKVFSRGKARFGVGQGSYMTENSRKAAEALVAPYLPEAAADHEIPMVFYMFTDVKTQTTDFMYYGQGAERVVRGSFDAEPKDGMAVLPGVVSRKKQIIPPIMATLQHINEDEKDE